MRALMPHALWYGCWPEYVYILLLEFNLQIKWLSTRVPTVPTNISAVSPSLTHTHTRICTHIHVHMLSLSHTHTHTHTRTHRHTHTHREREKASQRRRMQVKSVSGVSCYYETATNDQTIPPTNYLITCKPIMLFAYSYSLPRIV